MADEQLDQLDETEAEPDQPNRGLGSRVAETGREAASQAVQNAAQRAASQTVRRAALTAARGAMAAVATNPLVIGAVIVALVIVGVLFLGVALGGNDLAGSGTSQTVPFDTTSTADLSVLRTAVNGGVDTVAKAQAVLTEIAKLKTQLSGNVEALAILNTLETAARAIIVADPTDTTTIQTQAKIIEQQFRALESLIGSRSCGNISPCLDVEGIAENIPTHCGRVSALMVLLYVNRDQGTTYFNPSRYIQTINGQKEDIAAAENCLSDPTMDRLSPPDRRGWKHIKWGELSGGSDIENKEKIMTTINNSLGGGDPVILYFEPGGIFSTSKHIVVVVGYDASDEPTKGGTYLINNPNIHSVTVKTKFGESKDKKLTGDWLKQYMGGDGNPYVTSILARRKYLND